MDDNKYRVARQIVTESVSAPGLIMDFMHDADDNLWVIVYNDNLRTFEAGVRKGILMSLLKASEACTLAGIPLYIKREEAS